MDKNKALTDLNFADNFMTDGAGVAAEEGRGPQWETRGTTMGAVPLSPGAERPVFCLLSGTTGGGGECRPVPEEEEGDYGMGLGAVATGKTIGCNLGRFLRTLRGGWGVRQTPSPEGVGRASSPPPPPLPLRARAGRGPPQARDPPSLSRQPPLPMSQFRGRARQNSPSNMAHRDLRNAAIILSHLCCDPPPLRVLRVPFASSRTLSGLVTRNALLMPCCMYADNRPKSRSAVGPRSGSAFVAHQFASSLLPTPL